MNVIPLSTYIEKVKNNGIITLGRITRKRIEKELA